MARPLDHDKRIQLLGEVVRYISEHGLVDLSLRPLAAALGTSSRMLIYYFGTKEELLVQALATQHPDLGSLFAEVSTIDALRRRLEDLWTSTTVGESSVSAGILLQVIGVAPQQHGLYEDFARSAIDRLVGALADAIARCGCSPGDAVSTATIAVSGLRGILQDRLVTGDVERTDRSAMQLVDLVTRTVAAAPQNQ
ncbi:TetR/AcrR family transcriptional regulator [Rhodococcus sp. NPDC059234]|uniref:TetR/AcrR family transcriptional regulator n=1 Tax=Rhodococcus sp. NPDC059234 TaxID=3346781 RepID=UPI00366F076B